MDKILHLEFISEPKEFFRIELFSPDHVFYAGGTIEGNVIVDLQGKTSSTQEELLNKMSLLISKIINS